MRHTLLLCVALALSFILAPDAHAATITVTTTADELAANSACSLREAIIAANTNTSIGGCAAGSSTGTDTISVPSGTYTLSRSSSGSDTPSIHDLDITSAIKINGAGIGKTVIETSTYGRILEVHPQAALTLTGATVQRGNSDAEHGGGIFNGGKLTLDKILIANNEAIYYGGGIYNAVGASATITNSTLRNNLAYGGDGGGIANFGTLRITYSTIDANSAELWGGGIFNKGTLQIHKSTLSNNSASDSEDGSGGGLSNVEGTATLINTTVSGNRADSYDYGVGGLQNLSTLYLYNTTVTQNKGFIGGVRASAAITLANTVIAGDQSVLFSGFTPGGPPDCSGTLASQGYNLIGNTTGCTISGDSTGNKLNVAADLGPLARNGGPTLTHMPAAGSPAIDAGNPAAVSTTPPACPNRDQRDVSRPRDGNGDGAARCDMGAVER